MDCGWPVLLHLDQPNSKTLPSSQTIKACSCFRQSQSSKLHLHEKRHGGPTTGIFTTDGGESLPESTECLQPTLVSSHQENETHKEEPHWTAAILLRETMSWQHVFW